MVACSSAFARDKRLLILGDSISAGYGIELSQGWVTLLQKELAEKHHGVEVVNASISGETSDGVLRRLPILLDRYQPSWVVIEIGGNDGLRGYPLAGLGANLDAIISHCQASGAKVLLLGMKIPPNYGRRYTEAFNQLYHTAASRFAVPLVPFFLETIAGDAGLMQDDGIHPTADAQPKMMDALLPHVLALMNAQTDSDQSS